MKKKSKIKNQYYLPPGSIVSNAISNAETKIEIISFNEDFFEEKVCKNIDELFFEDRIGFNTWINVDGIHNNEIIEKIGKKFNIHYLTLEDVVNVDQRPKYENYDAYNVAFLKLLFYENDILKTEQLSIILTEKYIITFQEIIGGDPFNAIRERLRQAKGRVRKCGADYLAYALIDAVVDSYFIILDEVERKVDEFDLKLQEAPTPEILKQLHHARRELLFMRKSVAPMRELILNMSRDDDKLFTQTTQIYMRDLLDHQIRITESIDNYREIISEMVESYMSGTSFKMNEIMKVLTVISTFFIPLTFIVGVYGMNFDNMPELHTKYGYYFVWLAMIITVLSLLYYFRKKDWL